MRNRLLLLTFLLPGLFARAQHYFKQQADYRIDVTVNEFVPSAPASPQNLAGATDQHSLDGFLSLLYTNHSPDTLFFLWFNVWPNAYKNDRTPYSEYMLNSGRNDFYFSDNEQRGYINRLEFRSGAALLRQEVMDNRIDVIKVYLRDPLPPGEKINISTPFHVKLPYQFSGYGYNGHALAMTNWYPQVAVYDSLGWHPSSFTGQSGSSSESGHIQVMVTVPSHFTVNAGNSATGSLTDSSAAFKTLNFEMKEANDFSWRTNPYGYTPPRNEPKGESVLCGRLSTVVGKLLSKNWLPAVGYNAYDGFQIGALTQNLADTESRLTYFISSLYATNSNRITGFGLVNYTWSPRRYFARADAGLSVSAFSTGSGRDSINKKIFTGFYKLAPYIKLTFPSASAQVTNSIELKSYLLGEQRFEYELYSADSFYHPTPGKTAARYLNQLTLSHTVSRSLYPYDASIQLQQASSFYRLNGELHYFYNYARGGGMQVRMFAAKFGYLGPATSSKRFGTLRFQPKLTAVTGSDDYTYSNYFVGRNDFNGLNAQQLMVRDGGLKLRTDMFQDLQGRSDNWVMSANFNTTLPGKLFPVKLPLRIFLDAGTYAGAWKKESDQPRFLYVAGLQLSLFRDLINVYAPFLYSKTFRDNLKSVPDQNTFGKRVSFSFDLQRLDPLIKGNKPLY